MESILISIIVPVYNVKDYVSKCIESLLCQTHSNIEIIIVDDGSNDGSGEVVDNYASRDNRIVAIHQDNKGLSGARNSGLEIMHGDYVMFVDGDDYVEKDFCEAALDLITSHHVEIATFGYRMVWDGDSRTQDMFTANPRYASKQETIKVMIERVEAVYNMACNKIFASHLFDGITFPVGRTFEDMAVMHLLIDKASTNVYFSDKILYNYMQARQDSIMNNKMSPKHLHDRLIGELERLDFIKEKYPALKKTQASCLVHLCLQCFMYLPEDNPCLKDAKRFFDCNITLVVGATTGPRRVRVLFYYLMPPLFRKVNKYLKKRYPNGY